MKFMDFLIAAAQSVPTKRQSIPQMFGGGHFSGGSGSAGGGSTNELRLSTVWACVRIISETIPTLPLSLYERLPNGSRRKASDHPLHTLISSSPNQEMTAFNYWEAVIASLLLRGNAYSEKKYIGGRLVALEFLMPQNVHPDRSGKFYIYREKGGSRKIPINRIFHIPAFSLDGKTGLSPIQYGANVFRAAANADLAAGNTFQNGLMPTVAFTVDRKMNPEQREEFRAYVQSVSGALHSGQSPVLEEGVNAKTIGINPADAQLLESRAWSVEEICRWYRVPPWLVSHTQKSTSFGTGIEHQLIGFLTFTLNPWLVRIAQSINKHLLLPEERGRYYSEHTPEGLLRADSAARASYYGTMVDKGLMDRDECRDLENLPRRGGNAGKLTVQRQMVALDDI